MQEQKESKKKRALNDYVKYSGLGFQMIVTMCLGAWAGIKLDQHFGVKSHLFTIFLLLFSVIASIYFAISTIMRGNK